VAQLFSLGIVRTMKRGIEILIMWLVIAFCANLLAPYSIPQNGFERLVYFITVGSFPFAAWSYARHSTRVSPVICFGLIAGVFSILPVFTDARGMARDITIGWQFVIGGVPVLMTLVCVGIFYLRRFLDRDDAHHDA
jgi:hypothetical protein